MPCIRGVTIKWLSQRSTSTGSSMLKWWKRISTKVAVCHTDSANGDTPITTTWAARQGTDMTISAKWKRSAVEASRSRSTWWGWWQRQSQGILWTAVGQVTKTLPEKWLRPTPFRIDPFERASHRRTTNPHRPGEGKSTREA